MTLAATHPDPHPFPPSHLPRPQAGPVRSPAVLLDPHAATTTQSIAHVVASHYLLKAHRNGHVTPQCDPVTAFVNSAHESHPEFAVTRVPARDLHGALAYSKKLGYYVVVESTRPGLHGEALHMTVELPSGREAPGPTLRVLARAGSPPRLTLVGAQRGVPTTIVCIGGPINRATFQGELVPPTGPDSYGHTQIVTFPTGAFFRLRHAPALSLLLDSVARGRRLTFDEGIVGEEWVPGSDARLRNAEGSVRRFVVLHVVGSKPSAKAMVVHEYDDEGRLPEDGLCFEAWFKRPGLAEVGFAKANAGLIRAEEWICCALPDGDVDEDKVVGPVETHAPTGMVMNIPMNNVHEPNDDNSGRSDSPIAVVRKKEEQQHVSRAEGDRHHPTSPFPGIAFASPEGAGPALFMTPTSQIESGGGGYCDHLSTLIPSGTLVIAAERIPEDRDAATKCRPLVVPTIRRASDPGISPAQNQVSVADTEDRMAKPNLRRDCVRYVPPRPTPARPWGMGRDGDILTRRTGTVRGNTLHRVDSHAAALIMPSTDPSGTMDIDYISPTSRGEPLPPRVPKPITPPTISDEQDATLAELDACRGLITLGEEDSKSHEGDGSNDFHARKVFGYREVSVPPSTEDLEGPAQYLRSSYPHARVQAHAYDHVHSSMVMTNRAAFAYCDVGNPLPDGFPAERRGSSCPSHSSLAASYPAAGDRVVFFSGERQGLQITNVRKDVNTPAEMDMDMVVDLPAE